MCLSSGTESCQFFSFEFNLTLKKLILLLSRQQSIHMTALARRLIEEELKGQPNLRCLEFPSFFGSGFIQ